MSRCPSAIVLVAVLVCPALLSGGGPAVPRSPAFEGEPPLAPPPPPYAPLRTAREQQTLLAEIGAGPWPGRASPSAEQRIERALHRSGADLQQTSPALLTPELISELQTELALFHDRRLNPVQVRAWTESVQARLLRSSDAGTGSRATRPHGAIAVPFGSFAHPPSDSQGFDKFLDDIALGTSRDLQILAGKVGTPEENLFAAGRTSTQALLLGSLAADSGRSLVTGIAPTTAGGPVLSAVGQWAGPVGWSALAAYEGFTVWQWQRGYMTDRQFTRHQVHFMGGLAVGAAGGWAGAKAGAVAGGFLGAIFGPAGVPIGAAVGATLGAVSGGLLASSVGSRVSLHSIHSVFEFQDRKREAQYLRFLQQHYGVP